MIRALSLFPILLLIAQPSIAIREGTATAEVFIKRYAQSGDYGRLALWHEAAAECLTRISLPMNEIAHAYYTRHGYEQWVMRAEKEAYEIRTQYLHHRTSTEVAWQKFVRGVCPRDSFVYEDFVGGVCPRDSFVYEDFVGGVCPRDSFVYEDFVGGVCPRDSFVYEDFVRGVCPRDSFVYEDFVGGVCPRDSFVYEDFVGGVCNPDVFSVLDAERRNIEKFMATWLPRYPNRFYEFGIYPTFFRKQRALAEQEGSYAKVLRLEADAAEMCAAQYQQIPIAHGLKRYEKFRDVYLRHAMHLRELAKQNPMTLPPEIDKGRRISNSLAIQTVSSQQIGYRLSDGWLRQRSSVSSSYGMQSLFPYRKAFWLTAESIAQQCALIADGYFQIAKSDARVKTTLASQNGVHAYLSFQGFAWIVSFSNHSRGNLATAIIDAKTMKVLDVCIPSPGRSGLMKFKYLNR